MTYGDLHCTSVFFRKSNFHPLVHTRPYSSSFSAPPSAEVQRHNLAQWGWEICLSQGEANPTGGPLVERLEKYIFCSEHFMSQGQSSWYVSNTECYETYLKTKIRRVELSPTVSQMWKMFRYEKFHLWGPCGLFDSATSHVHREQTLQSSMAIPKKKEGNENAANMYDIHLSLSRGGKQPIQWRPQLGSSFKSPDSAIAWGLPGCHSPRHTPEKGQGVCFGINPGADEDEPWCTSWLGSKCFDPIFFGVNARGKPPSSRSVFNCYPPMIWRKF